jgi:drug/metabolite transporter (DMT)-like permease
MRRTKAMPMIFMLLAGACYGLVSPLIRFEYTKGFTAADLTNAQYGIAFVITWLIVLARHHKSVIRKNQWFLLIALGIAAALVSICYYTALTVLPASFATVLLFQFAWMATFIDIVVTRSMPSLLKWLGLVVIIGGTFLAVGMIADSSNSGTASSGGHYSLWAIGLGLLSALFYTLTLYLSGYVSESISPELRSAIVITVGMLVIFIPFRPTYLISGILWHGLLGWGGLIAIVGQVAPMLLMLIAIPLIGGRMAAILGTIELPVSICGAWLLNGEFISIARWSGVFLIIVGILVSESDEWIRGWWNWRWQGKRNHKQKHEQKHENNTRNENGAESKSTTSWTRS